MDLWRAAATDILSHPARVCFILPPILGLAATLSHLSQVGLIKKHGLRLRKGLGQHILTDDNVARKIVGALDLGERDGVIEIGPGLGALTLRVAPAARRVVAVEIDRRFAAALREELNGTGNVEIIEENFLKVDLGEITRSRGDVKTWKLVGNLPYYITSAILMMLVEGREHFQSAVITVQDEFARRLVAAPGSKDYSSLSIYVQYRFKPEILFTIKPTSFFPRPDVRSAVVRLEVLERPRPVIEDEGLFFQTIRAAFGQRRKTLRRSLRKMPGLTPELIGELDRTSGVGLDSRPEDISLEDFATLSNAIKDVIG